MPTKNYTNDPNKQNDPDYLYAPDLPWWNSPGSGGAVGAVDGSGRGAVSPGNIAAEEGYYGGGQYLPARPPALTPDRASQAQGGSLSLADITAGFVSPVYGGGSVETTPSGGFNFSSSPASSSRYKQPTGSTTPSGGFSPSSPPRYKQPTGATTTATTQKVFEGARPELTLPKRDERRVERLRQQAAGPGVRKLRTALSRALVRSYENPNVAKMITRSALAGYGEGLESVLSGASRTAESQYQSELGISTQEALGNYQATLNEYMAKAKSVTTQTTKNVYADALNPRRGQSNPALGIA